MVVSGGKEREHPNTLPLAELLSNAASNTCTNPDTPLNITTSITFPNDDDGGGGGGGGGAKAINADHGRRLGWRAEHTCAWLPDANGKRRLMCIGGYEDGSHLSSRLLQNMQTRALGSLYKQDLHEYVPGIGWVKWRTTGDMFRPGAQYWICDLGGVVYCGGGYGNLQDMAGAMQGNAMPMLFSDVFEIKLLDYQDIDRVQVRHYLAGFTKTERMKGGIREDFN